MLYRAVYARWHLRREPRLPGYSVLLPVPADLPVFLKIAMNVIARQEQGARAETLVVPDYSLPAFEAAFERYRAAWPADQPIRVVHMDPLSRLLARRRRNPHLNYWLQVVHGIQELRTRYAVLHDADLFLCDRDFLDRHYRSAVQAGAACRGVSPVWDVRYRQKGYRHLVATWELLFDAEWATGFAPWQHRGFEGDLDGERHIFDVTLFPQCRTAPERILLQGDDGQQGDGDGGRPEGGFVHFNYVISSYRWFQKSMRERRPFEDEHFRILLVRLLIDALDDSGWRYEAPVVSELERGLRDEDAPVTYRKSTTASQYLEFRMKLEGLLELLSSEQADSIRRGVGAFDVAFGWADARAAGLSGAAVRSSPLPGVP